MRTLQLTLCLSLLVLATGCASVENYLEEANDQGLFVQVPMVTTGIVTGVAAAPVTVPLGILSCDLDIAGIIIFGPPFVCATVVSVPFYVVKRAAWDLPKSMLPPPPPATLAEYRAQPRKARPAYLGRQNAAWMDALLHQQIAYSTRRASLRRLHGSPDRLVADTSSWFQLWAEKCLRENRRLTPESILVQLRDEQQPFAWRLAFRGYLQAAVANPSEAAAIGLTADERELLEAVLSDFQIDLPG